MAALSIAVKSAGLAARDSSMAAAPSHRAKGSATPIGTMRYARSSSRVRRWTRGHSLANAHSTAGANANGYAYRWKKTRVGAGSPEGTMCSRSGGGIPQRMAGRMCNGATVALSRKKTPSRRVRRSRRPTDSSRHALAACPMSRPTM